MHADSYNWCIVPKSGSDAILYAAVAILVGCLVQGKLSSVWILVAGALLCRAVADNALQCLLGMHEAGTSFDRRSELHCVPSVL